MWASRNHRSLSAARVTSVNRSAVALSPSLSVSSMAVRAALARVASRFTNAFTCSSPFTALKSYSLMALGDQVRLIFQMAGDGIEQFMQLEKLGSFHVPMRVLYLRLQIDRVGETRVQNFDDFGLRVFLEIDAAGKMNFGSCGGHYFLLSGRSLGRSLVCILCIAGNGSFTGLSQRYDPNTRIGKLSVLHCSAVLQQNVPLNWMMELAVKSQEALAKNCGGCHLDTKMATLRACRR